MVGQGVATLIGADTAQATFFTDETVSNLRRPTPYGFSHKPKAGAQVYAAFVGGDRAAGFALIVGDKRYVMDLQDGEVAIHDDDGNHVLLGKGGNITVNAKTKLTLNAPMIEFNGQLMHNGKSVGSNHHHTTNGLGQATSDVN